MNWQKAFRLIQQGKPDMACLILNKLAQTQPVHPQVYHGLGIIALEKNEINQAYNWLSKAHTQLEKDASFASHFGLALHRLHRLDEALIWLNKATVMMPDEPGFWANYGYGLESKKDWPQMQHAFMQALHLQPNSLEFALGCAVALRQQQHYLAALQRLAGFIERADLDDAFYQEWLLNVWLAYDEEQTWQTIKTLPQQNASFYCAIADYFDEQLPRNPNLTSLLKRLYQLALEIDPNQHDSQHMLDLLDEDTRSAINQIPAEYIERLYDAHADQFDAQLVSKLKYQAPIWFADVLSSEFKSNPNHPSATSLLDLGCGTGLFAKALANKGITISATGVDMSANMLEKARATGCYKQLIKQNLNDFLAQAGPIKYELISALDVLIYQGEYQSFLAHSKRLLTSGGYLAVTLECANIPSQSHILHHNGRFKHGLDEFIEQANSTGLQLVHKHVGCLRLEDHQEVAGAYLLFQA